LEKKKSKKKKSAKKISRLGEEQARELLLLNLNRHPNLIDDIVGITGAVSTEVAVEVSQNEIIIITHFKLGAR
jgi:hypothetical protein